jgi:lipopolysaccharide/colanic/teichoic acid biosynthesis glycosyltransferase
MFEGEGLWESAVLGFPAVLIRSPTELLEVPDAGTAVMGGIAGSGIVQAMDLAVSIAEANAEVGCVPDYQDTSASTKAARITESHAKIRRAYHPAAEQLKSWGVDHPNRRLGLASPTRISGQMKRAFDIMVSALGVFVLSPVLLALALLVAVKFGTPTLFSQGRPGLGGRVFRLYKFRTMTDARDASGKLLSDEQRLTPFGRFLRSTSLDELPELWNVLKGDMSLVGPRPLLVQYLDRYTPEQARRHEVRPGVTGLAQVSGRNQLSWDERFELDVWYVDNMSLWLDLKILCRTLWKTVRREGITSGEHATMTEFRGNGGGPCE